MKQVSIVFSLLVLGIGLFSGCKKTSTSSPTSPVFTVPAQVVAAWFSVASSKGIQINGDGTASVLKLDGAGKVAINTTGASFRFTSFQNGSWAGKRFTPTAAASDSVDASGIYTILDGKFTLVQTVPSSDSLVSQAARALIGGNPLVSLDVVASWYSPSQYGGYDIRADGTARQLITDAGGILIYNPYGPTIVYSAASDGSWAAVVTPYGGSPEADAGTYAISSLGVLTLNETSPKVQTIANDLVQKTIGTKVR